MTDKTDKLVSIIIPCLNERNTILKVIDNVQQLPCNKEIIVVDNGSYDGTYQIIQNLAFNNLKILREPRKGKGYALRKGIEHATGEYIIFQDADLEYDSSTIVDIIRLLNDYEAVITKRICYPYSIKILPFIANKIVIYLVKKLFHKSVSDIFTGQRGYRREVIERFNIESKGFEIETELTVKMLLHNIMFTECNVIYTPRSEKRIGFFDFVVILNKLFTLYFHYRPDAITIHRRNAPTFRHGDIRR